MHKLCYTNNDNYTDMDYREEITKALSKVFYSDCGQYYTAIACEFKPLNLFCNTDFVADVDAAVEILKKHVWTFRTNNSDAAAKGLKMPPEIGVILSLLERCVRIFDGVTSETYADPNARLAWSIRTGVFETWAGLIRQYYPPVVPASKKGNKRAAGRPDRPIEYYMLTDDKEGYKDTLRKNMDVLKKIGGGECSAKDVGGFIGVEIEKGRLRNDVSVAEFCRVFNLKCRPQSVGKYIPEALRPKRNKRQS